MHNYYNIYVSIITKIQNTLITSAIAAGYATIKPIYIDDYVIQLTLLNTNEIIHNDKVL